MKTSKNNLVVIDNCSGCGVCCLHMGFPTFMLPREPATDAQIDASLELQQLLHEGWTRQELRDGHPGETHWHRLPGDLRREWQSFVQQYRRPEDLDSACFWLDPETRLCLHHEFRPQVCRDFEIGSETCYEWRSFYKDEIVPPA